MLDAAKLVTRIDLRFASLELVCDIRSLQPKRHPELALDDIRSRLQDGEKALVDDADGRRIRISLPTRAQFRGGRTWIEGDVRANRCKTAAQANPPIAAAVRRAHMVARTLGGSPLRKSMQILRSPTSSYEARVVMLAFLAPDVQIDLLHGRHRSHLTVEALTAHPPPLLWREQRAWLQSL